ncbi:MAG TPA: tetratricopeptide repeat protein [Vicinamibacterales bacterium]
MIAGRIRTGLICASLLAATWGIYRQVREFPLVDFDDLSYVTDNAHVTTGLSAANVEWAFTHAYEGYWMPLTWISYMADASVFGGAPGAYHLTNLALHAATGFVVFFALVRLTREPWPSALAAALFAVHPMHVESVAWVAERKDVLSGLFFFLALWAYARYAERPHWTSYALVMLAFACGLMSKPIVVTLPLVLIALDWWPLRRIGRRALVEKLPLFAMAAAMAVVTVITQQHAGAVAGVSVIPVSTRIANALASTAWYPVRAAWPAGLAAIYPYPTSAPVGAAAIATVMLLVISIGVVRLRHRAPYLLTGWAWYLVTLAPVLGLIQAGPQARADRYSYLSMTGLAIMVIWGIAHATAGSTQRRETRSASRLTGLLAAIGCVVLGIYAAIAWQQVQYWRDGETLFRRALAVTKGNYVASTGLAAVLASQGRHEEAIAAYTDAVRTAPTFPEAYAGLGRVLLATDRAEAAALALTEAVRLAPRDGVSHANLGTALARTGRIDESSAAYREALRVAPESSLAHSGLANNLARQGRLAEATPHFRETARLNPGSAAAHFQLGNALAMQGAFDEAILELTTAARGDPGNAEIHSNLGIALASRGRIDEAVSELREAVRLDPSRPELRANLGFVLKQRQ